MDCELVHLDSNLGTQYLAYAFSRQADYLIEYFNHAIEKIRIMGISRATYKRYTRRSNCPDGGPAAIAYSPLTLGHFPAAILTLVAGLVLTVVYFLFESSCCNWRKKSEEKTASVTISKNRRKRYSL